MGFASKLFVMISAGVALFVAYFFVLNSGGYAGYSAMVAILAVILGFLILVWGRTPAHKKPSQEMLDAYDARLKELEAGREKRKDPSRLRAVYDDDD